MNLFISIPQFYLLIFGHLITGFIIQDGIGEYTQDFTIIGDLMQFIDITAMFVCGLIIETIIIM
jgi:hypothetical protein